MSPPPDSLDRLLATKSIAIFCGPGGVGKTSVAAASAAVAAARLGGKVLVVTVDPARRLADALGLSTLGNLERPVPDAERLRPNLGRLTETARAQRITIVHTADDHDPHDPEIADDPDFVETFPAHCLRGTPGADRLPETAAGPGSATSARAAASPTPPWR